MVNISEIVEKLKNEKAKLIEELRVEGEKIHEERCKVGKKLEVKIKNELNYVGLEKSIFKIVVDLEEKFTLNV